MNQLKIYNWLICITVKASEEQWTQVCNFLEHKKHSIQQLLCITSCGKESYSKWPKLAEVLREKKIVYRFPGLVSRPNPEIADTHRRIKMVTSIDNSNNGVVLISEFPLAELFNPIQMDLEFVDKDLFEKGENEDLLEEFTRSLKANPELVIYDAQTMQFIKQ